MQKILSIALALAVGAGSAAMAAGEKEAGGSAAGKPAAKTDLIIGTAGTAGTYYVVGAAMAQAINKHSQRLNVIA